MRGESLTYKQWKRQGRNLRSGDATVNQKSMEDLAEKIRYWLDHDEERRKVADTSYRWVHENATYTHRIKMALDYMEI
jgi:spore maturation protein CgeB